MTREREWKSFAIGSILLVCVCLLLAYGMQWYVGRQLGRQSLQFAENVAAHVLEGEGEDYQTPSAETREKVSALLQEIGYYDMDFANYSIENKRSIRLIGITQVISILFVLGACFLLGSLCMRRIYGRVDNIDKSIVKRLHEKQQNAEQGDAEHDSVGQKNEKQGDIALKERFMDGSFSVLYEHVQDIFKELDVQKKERKQEREYLKDMMSDISHQLKTPIASLVVFHDIFEEHVKDEKDDTIRKMLRESSNQLNRIQWLVLSLLKLARIEADAVKMDMKLQPLAITIERSMEALRLKQEEKGQIVSLHGDRDILLRHDADWLSEAIGNILKNAIEYTPAGGTIDIHISQNQLATMISIRDNGPGIRKEELPKIFNRFYRVSTKEKTTGVGIGLALAKSIVEEQGGVITVESAVNDDSVGIENRETYTEFVITFLAALYDFDEVFDELESRYKVEGV